MEKTTNEHKVWEVIKLIIFLIGAGIISLYIVFELFIPEQTVNVFGFKPYVVITQSMEPAIDRNDVVVVKNLAVDELEVGDIITFKTDINYDGEEEVVTHYIHSINRKQNGKYSFKTNRYYETEEQKVPDSWLILEDDILGEYMFHVPLIGAIILFLQSPFGIATMLVNIGVIISIVILIKQGKKERDDDIEQSEE